MRWSRVKHFIRMCDIPLLILDHADEILLAPAKDRRLIVDALGQILDRTAVAIVLVGSENPDYARLAGPAVDQYGGRDLVRGGAMETLEGTIDANRRWLLGAHAAG